MSYRRMIRIFLIVIIIQFIIQLPSYAIEGGFTIPIGEELVLPDDQFGSGNLNLDSKKGTLTGQVSYLFSYLQERKDSLLNRDGILFTLSEKDYLFDLQLNYNYNLQDQSRIYVSANLIEKKRVGGQFQSAVELREAFVNHDFKQNGILTLGKQKLNYGNGFGWNPTGVSKTKEGLIGAKWSVPYHGFTFMTIVVPPLAIRQTEKGLLYQKVETIFGPVNVVLSGLIREKEKPSVGIDLSTFLGDMEIYAAVSGQQDNFRTYMTEELSPNPFGGDLKNYQWKTRNDKSWYFQGIIGSTYLIPGTETYLMAEYFYDQTGLTADEIAAVGDAASYCEEKMKDEQIGLAGQYQGYLGKLNDYFVPGQMGQHYLFLGARSVKIVAPLSGNLYGIINLADQSGVLNPELTYSFTGNTSLVLSGSFLFGQEKSEYGLSVMEQKISLSTVTLF